MANKDSANNVLRSEIQRFSRHKLTEFSRIKRDERRWQEAAFAPPQDISWIIMREGKVFFSLLFKEKLSKKAQLLAQEWAASLSEELGQAFAGYDFHLSLDLIDLKDQALTGPADISSGPAGTKGVADMPPANAGGRRTAELSPAAASNKGVADMPPVNASTKGAAAISPPPASNRGAADISPPSAGDKGPLPIILAIASGKGGVGKSTTALNLALALKAQGLNIGLLDGDIYGPSLARLAGLSIGREQFLKDKKLVPFEKFGLKLMSIGCFIKEDQPVIWRAPMIVSAFRQLLYDVSWQGVDILLIDMPPGTGDIALSLAQQVKNSYVMLVTTPQELAWLDVGKALAMYRKLDITILGLIENMSYFIAPDSGKIYHLFGEGKIANLAHREGLELLAQIPLEPQISQGSDEGRPIFLQQQYPLYAQLYNKIAAVILERIAL